MKDSYGSFGAQATQYSAARQEFPKKIFAHLKERAGTRTRLLDIGCGTGIASRQLAQYGFLVTGSDIDERMISWARVNSPTNSIAYVVAPMRALPFPNHSFEIITAFSAFHWFCDDVSLGEIQRVLIRPGLLFIVNKNETGDMKSIIKRTLKNFSTDNQLPPDRKADYNPASILAKNGFDDIQEYTVPIVEEYTIDQALNCAQSMSIWNLVQLQKRDEAITALRETFLSYAEDKLVKRPLTVKAVSGYSMAHRGATAA